MSIANELQVLIDCKEDMKSAIIEKGVTPTGGLSTYADAIDEIILNKDIDVSFTSGTRFGYSEIKTVPDFVKRYVQEEAYKYHADISGMFSQCENLIEFPEIYTGYVRSFNTVCIGCKSLRCVPELDMDSCLWMSYAFEGCENLTDIGGFKNLGIVENAIITTGCFRGCPNITRQSCINIFNGLHDMSFDNETGYYGSASLAFEPEVLDRLTDEDIAIATNKAWDILSE